MSESFEFLVKTSCGSYRVRINDELLPVPTEHTQDIWLIDTNVARLHGDRLPENYILQEAVEAQKSLDAVQRIVEVLRDRGSTRNTRLVAVGGGIVQDLATFTASSYMRGISWSYFPTTLLSMVDSCIGGKSSLNVGCHKNIVGNFYPPDEIVIDTRFCATLSSEQMAEGFCEAAKICYASSDHAFSGYLTMAEDGNNQLQYARISEIIHHCLLTKKLFIEEDEFDKGVRLLLNFGHTFGHAIESASAYAISHGIAVGLGMLAAEQFSLHRGYIGRNLPNVARLTAHIRKLLRKIPTVRLDLRAMNPEAAIEYFVSDKKHTANAFTMILFDGDGRLQRVQLPRSDSVLNDLRQTFHKLFENYDEIQ